MKLADEIRGMRDDAVRRSHDRALREMDKQKSNIRDLLVHSVSLGLSEITYKVICSSLSSSLDLSILIEFLTKWLIQEGFKVSIDEEDACKLTISY